MDIISILTALLTLTAGIGVFLVACTMMSSNLESSGSRWASANPKPEPSISPLPRTPNVLPTTSSMWRRPFATCNKQYKPRYSNTGLTQD